MCQCWGAGTSTNRKAYMKITAKVRGEVDLATVVAETGLGNMPVTLLVISSAEGNLLPVSADETTRALIFEDEAYSKIHSGLSFHVSWTKDIPNGETMDVLMVIPENGRLPHLTIAYDSEAEISYEVFRSPTVSANGTLLPIYNRDENSSIVASSVLYHTPTITATGSAKIFDWHLGGGKASGGGDRGASERIMKRNTAYLFRIRNMTSSSNYCAMRFDWYESTEETS